jgi:hypothetical protein
MRSSRHAITTARFGGALGLASFVLLACSGSDSAAPPSAEDACNAYAEAACAKLDSCAKVYIQIEFGDKATCLARAKLGCLPSLNAPGTGTTTAQISSCASALPDASCADVLGRKMPEACKTVAGTRADGVACADDSQCVHELCRKPKGAACGVCSSPSAAGGACQSDGDCDDGLTCSHDVCTPFGAAGASCDETHPCNPTLVCKSGTCATPPALGSPCTDTLECGLIEGAVCHPTKKVCATLGIAAAGAACEELTGDTFSICGAKGTCKSKVCLAAAADGQPCDDEAGPKCTSPATCTGGVCKITDPSACN